MYTRTVRGEDKKKKKKKKKKKYTIITNKQTNKKEKDMRLSVFDPVTQVWC